MKYIYMFFEGKSTFFAFIFFSVGSALAFLGKLTPEYVAMASAVQLLLVTRSIMDDYHERNKPIAILNNLVQQSEAPKWMKDLLGKIGSQPAQQEGDNHADVRV